MKTKWLLVGNGNYIDNCISDVPAVLNSIDLLSESINSTFAENADIVVEKNVENSRFLSVIYDFFSSIPENTLPILYFCGHGFRKNKSLFLTAKDSSKKAIEHCSVEYSFIQERIMENHLKQAVVVLDCCYSGVANGLSITDGEEFEPLVDYPNIVCITSCKGIEQAYFKTVGKEEFAAFTYHFATILAEGINQRKHSFSFKDLYVELVKKLTSQEPTISSKGVLDTKDVIPNIRHKVKRPSIFSRGTNASSLKVLLVKSSIAHPIKGDGDFGVPLGLWLLKSYIQRTSANIQVDIYDERLRNLQKCTQTFEECIKEYDVIGVSMCSCEVPPSIEKMRIAKANGKITIAGGIFTYSNEEYLLSYPFVDFVIPGVGTKPLEHLLTELRKRKQRDPDNWKDIVCKQIGDKTFETMGLNNVFSRANMNDAVMWDAATMPHIELDIWDQILLLYGPYLGGKIDIYSSRGCNKTCSFCSVQRETKHNVISCDEQQVIRTIKYLYSKGIRQFSIKDEDFFIYGQSRIRNILEEFRDYDDISFKIRARIDTMLASNISSGELEEYHVKEIQYGVESPSNEMRQYVQKNMKKSTDDVIKLFKSHNEHGIVVNASFILGLPFESGDYYKALAEFIDKIYTPRFTKVYLNFYTPHPVRGKIPDDVNIVTNDLNYYTHKIPVCYPKNPRMKVLVRQKMLSTYNSIVKRTKSEAYNPQIPSSITQLFTHDSQLSGNDIMKYGEDYKC